MSDGEGTMAVGLLGQGQVGRALLEQITAHKAGIRTSMGLDIRITAVARSDQMLLSTGSTQSEVLSRLGSFGADKPTYPTDLNCLAEHLLAQRAPITAIVDCTSDRDIALEYTSWLRMGIHVVTANKLADSDSIVYYRALRQTARRNSVSYLNETTVGAALPILRTLRALVCTGDTIHRIEGVLSGTLNYILDHLSSNSVYQALLRARELGYTEPDPRSDLMGTDTARKAVIIAREAGLEISLSDLEMDQFLPEEVLAGPLDEHLGRLQDVDMTKHGWPEVHIDGHRANRVVGIIDRETGCGVYMRSYDANHPFARTRHTDNIVRIVSDRYRDNPLTIKGPGAGPDHAASALFADLLQIAGAL